MIIAIKEKDKVVLAYSPFDYTTPVTSDDMALEENLGIWKVRGNPHTVMGNRGAFAETDAFKYEEKLFRGEINYDSLTDGIIPAMEKFSEGKDYIGDEKGRYEEFFIAQKDKLFKITSEHLVMEIDSYAVSGGGAEDLAKGALHATEGQPVIDRIRKVFEFIARERQSVCYPISVIDTATCKIRKLKK